MQQLIQAVQISIPENQTNANEEYQNNEKKQT